MEGDIVARLESLIEEARRELVWDMFLSSNEELFGSAYGPWRVDKTDGLAAIIATIKAT
jgi:hypothetical protein